MLIVRHGTRAVRTAKKTLEYDYDINPTEEVEVNSISYSLQPITLSAGSWSSLRSLAPKNPCPNEVVGVARSGADQLLDRGQVEPTPSVFVSDTNPKFSYGRDSRSLINFSGGGTYPAPDAAVYIQYIRYTTPGGYVQNILAPDRALQQVSARYIPNDYYSAFADSVDGVDRFIATNTETVELTFECEKVTFYDVNGSEVDYYGAWVRYDVTTVYSTVRVGQNKYVKILSEVPAAVQARQGRGFRVIETEE